MENKAISRHLKLLGQLLDLNGDNPFKIKSISNAAFKIDKLPFPLAKKSLAEIEQIDGLGKSIAAKVWEIITTGKIDELDNLLSIIPAGIVEMLAIKGLGPKKILSIWNDLQIDNIGELYYACNENRLVEAKGFGIKSQGEIQSAIEFKMASNGRFLYARMENFANSLLEYLKLSLKIDLVCLVGAFRRKAEILDGLDILTVASTEQILQVLSAMEDFTIISQTDDTLEASHSSGIKVYFNSCTDVEYSWKQFELTGVPQHVEEMKSRLINFSFKSEKDIYTAAHLQFIEPELREDLGEIQLAFENKIPELVSFNDIKGALHNHSTWSDGVHTIEEMAVFCRDELGLSYFGISDHSKTASYAKGLDEIRVAAQQREIDHLNVKLAPFKIFKGIESDILANGSLDYADEILKTFDFVVASIHSGFKMDEDKATNRLIKAIENPYTTILGHPTGRLLLSRSGYPVDFRKIIDACAANNVVIEINANPLRLDMDWRHQRYAMEKGVLVSVNPDAHSTNGFYDMHYGIASARKGMVSKENCLNCFNLQQITQHFENKNRR